MILQETFHLNGLSTHYMTVESEPFIFSKGSDMHWYMKKNGMEVEAGWEVDHPYLIALDTNEITEENKDLWFRGIKINPEIVHYLAPKFRTREVLEVIQKEAPRLTVFFDTDMLTREDYLIFVKDQDFGLKFLKECKLITIDLVNDYKEALDVLRANPYALKDMESFSNYEFIKSLPEDEKNVILEALNECNSQFGNYLTVELKDEDVLDIIRKSPKYIKNLTESQLKLENVREYIVGTKKNAKLYNDLTYAEAADCLDDCWEIFNLALNKFFVNLTREDIQNLLVLHVMQGHSFDPRTDWKAMKELVDGTDLVLFLLTNYAVPAMIFANLNEIGYKFNLQQEIVLFFNNIDNLSLIEDVNENLCKLYADDLEEITDKDFEKTIPARFKSILKPQVMRIVYNNLF